MTAPLVFRDRINDRLVFVDRKADEGFWDKRWSAIATAAEIRKKNLFVQRQTRRYLPPKARVLDAGCGLANTVFGLHHDGFEAYGVDFASATVAQVNKHAPELAVSVADVRRLPFGDAFFDGVWSIGVIEHFHEGYDQIIQEARRVIRSKGYLFLVVPSISPLRRLKTQLRIYPELGEVDLTKFYQFAFHPAATAHAISRMGFRMIASKPRGGYLGLIKECGSLEPFLAHLHSSRNSLAIAARRGLDLLLNPISFHSKLFVFVRE